MGIVEVQQLRLKRLRIALRPFLHLAPVQVLQRRAQSKCDPGHHYEEHLNGRREKKAYDADPDKPRYEAPVKTLCLEGPFGLPPGFTSRNEFSAFAFVLLWVLGSRHFVEARAANVGALVKQKTGAFCPATQHAVPRPCINDVLIPGLVPLNERIDVHSREEALRVKIIMPARLGHAHTPWQAL